MKLKLDQAGRPVTDENGDIIHIDDNGTEIGVDPNALYAKLASGNRESKQRKLKLREMDGDLMDKIQGTILADMSSEGAKQFVSDGMTALEIINDLAAQHAQDLKDISTGAEAELADSVALRQQEHDMSMGILNETSDKQDQFLYDKLIGEKFSTSKYFNGDNPLTVLPAGIAFSMFSEAFSVNMNTNVPVLNCIIDGKLLLNDLGFPITDFDKCIAHLIETHSNKNSIYAAANTGGTGSNGAAMPEAGRTAKQARLSRAYNDAMSKGDAQKAISIKNKIYENRPLKKSTPMRLF